MNEKERSSPSPTDTSRETPSRFLLGDELERRPDSNETPRKLVLRNAIVSRRRSFLHEIISRRVDDGLALLPVFLSSPFGRRRCRNCQGEEVFGGAGDACRTYDTPPPSCSSSTKNRDSQNCIRRFAFSCDHPTPSNPDAYSMNAAPSLRRFLRRSPANAFKFCSRHGHGRATLTLTVTLRSGPGRRCSSSSSTGATAAQGKEEGLRGEGKEEEEKPFYVTAPLFYPNAGPSPRLSSFVSSRLLTNHLIQHLTSATSTPSSSQTSSPAPPPSALHLERNRCW